MNKKEIVIGADHGGFEIKERVKSYLMANGFLVHDISPTLVEGDDYPDVAGKLGHKVLKSKNMGVLVCGTGTGMCIAINKMKGIRAVMAYDKYTSIMARKDNDSNVMCLRGRKIYFWRVKRIVKAFLETEFSGETRHKRRIKKIDSIKWV